MVMAFSLEIKRNKKGKKKDSLAENGGDGDGF